MGVFLKYISKNMLEKKGRLFLLIFSILCCTALLIMSLGLVDVLLDSFNQPQRIAAEGQDIAMTSNGASPFFSEEDIRGDVHDFRGSIRITGVINENDDLNYVTLNGLKGYSKDMVEGGIEDVNEEICVISDRIAKDRGLKVGDKLTIAVNGKKTGFTVKGIAANNGAFYADTKKNFAVMVPYSYMNELLGAGGKYNYMTAKIDSDDKSFENIEKAVKSFNEKNTDIAGFVLVNDSKDGSESITVGLYAMLSIVCIVCIIIIYGAFKLIITERITVIGTFMSQGATRRKIEHILLIEALLYGLLGSAFGIGVGIGGLALLTRLISPLRDYGIYMPLRINGMHILIGALFACLLSVISAFLPIRSIRKLQVKDVILNRTETQHKKGSVRFVVGLLLLGTAIASCFFKSEALDDLSILFMLAGIVGMLMMSRKFIKIVSDKLAGAFRGNTTVFLSLNSIKTSKLLRGNITLLVLSLSSVLLIASIGTSMTELVKGGYEQLIYDYQLNNVIVSNSDKANSDLLVERIGQIDGIDPDRICTMTYETVKFDDNFAVIMAADPTKFCEYCEYLQLRKGETGEQYARYEADQGNVIMVSRSVLKKLDKKVGNSLEIEVNGRKQDFEIVGSFDGKALNGGTTILMRETTLKKAFNIKESSAMVFFRKPGVTEEQVDKQLRSAAGDLGAVIYTKQEMLDDNVRNNAMIVDILSIFTYLALIIASIGIFNNISICFAQRRKEFAVMASVGMNSGRRRNLILSESMISVIWSVVASIPYTILLCKLTERVLLMSDMAMDISFSWIKLPVYVAAVALVIFIASLGSMKKSRKLNVVAELKYE